VHHPAGLLGEAFESWGDVDLPADELRVDVLYPLDQSAPPLVVGRRTIEDPDVPKCKTKLLDQGAGTMFTDWRRGIGRSHALSKYP